VFSDYALPLALYSGLGSFSSLETSGIRVRCWGPHRVLASGIARPPPHAGSRVACPLWPELVYIPQLATEGAPLPSRQAACPACGSGCGRALGSNLAVKSTQLESLMELFFQGQALKL